MEDIPKILEDASTKIVAITRKTEKFLHKDTELFDKTKLFAKVVYDVNKLIEVESNKLTLPELIIENFDSEQVWAGIEIQNKQKYDRLDTKFMLTNSSELSQFSLLLGKPKKMDNVGNLDDKRDNQDVPEDLDNLSEHLDDTMSNLESEDEKNEDDNSEGNENEDILND